MSNWSPNFNSFIDLLNFDSSMPNVPESSDSSQPCAPFSPQPLMPYPYPLHPYAPYPYAPPPSMGAPPPQPSVSYPYPLMYPYHPYPHPPSGEVEKSCGTAAPSPIPSSGGSESEGHLPLSKRNKWTKEDEEKLVNAWLVESEKNKPGGSFWGNIANTYNSTTEPPCHRTGKQLKDHWHVGSQVSKFNNIYITKDGVMEKAKAMYAEKMGHEFKLEH